MKVSLMGVKGGSPLLLKVDFEKHSHAAIGSRKNEPDFNG